MDPTTGGANPMRLAPDYEPPTRSRRDGSHGRGDTSDGMPTARMDADASGGEMPGSGTMGAAATGEMPRGEMHTHTPDVRNRLVGAMEGETDADGTSNGGMPSGGMPNGGMSNGGMSSDGMPGDGTDASGPMPTGAAAGSMPTGAMTGATGAAIGAGPGPDGMPAGTMREPPDRAKPGDTTPNRATLEGVVGGLTIRGEWRLTLSSVSTGSGG